MTDVRKAATANDVSSKHKMASKATTSSSRRSAGSKSGKPTASGRDIEKDQDEDQWFEDERESFPQFWYVYSSYTSLPGLVP